MALTIDQLQVQIEADSNSANSAINNLIGRLEALQRKLNVLGSAGKNAGNGLNATASGATKAATATDKHRNATDKASKSTKSFTDKLAQQISKTRTLYGAFKNAANMMAGWFKESNDYIETLNLFNVTMGDAAPAAREYAKSVEMAMGIDSKDFMQYQGVFKNLTAGFGVVEKDANKMSQNLTQLSYDMASFFNTDVETAFDKLSSAMSGQVKGLREFGIDTTVATLQEYALSKGIQTKVRNMTQAEKAMLRYNYILEKSTHMQGDMARTIITPANALRVLEAQLTRAKRALGNIVSVIVTKFIPYVQAMVQVVEEAAISIANFLGFDSGDFSEVSQGVANSWGDAEDSVDGYTDSLKKAQKQMMGFDELNIIKNTDSDSSVSGGGASGGLGGMGLKEYDFLKNIDTSGLEKVKEKLKEILGTVKPLATLFAGIFSVATIMKWVSTIGAAIATITSTIYGTNIGFAFLAWAGGAATFVESIKYVSQSMSTMQKVFLGVATVVAEFLVVFTLVKDLTYAINTGTATTGQIITTLIGIVGALTAAFVAFSIAFNSTGIGLVITLCVGAVAALVGVAKGLESAGKAAYESTEDFKIMQASIETTEAISQRCATSISSMKSAVDKLDESSMKYAIAKNLTTEIFDLNEKAHLSQYELAQIKTKVDVLNGLNIDGLHLAIDETTGRVINTREETEKLIAALEKEARMEAMKDILVEAYKAQYQATKDLDTAGKELDKTFDAMHETEEKLNNTSIFAFYQRSKLKAQLEKQKEAYNKAKDACSASREVLEEANGTISNVSKEYENLVTKQDKVTESTKNAADAIGDAAKGANTNAANVVAGATKGINDNARTYTKAIKDMAKGGNSEFATAIDSHSPAKVYVGYAKNIVLGLVNGLNGNKQTLFNTIKSLANDMGSTFNKSLNFNGMVNEINKSLKNIKIPTFKNISLDVTFSTWVSDDKKKVYKALGLSGWPTLKWYANGGFPSIGEMFIAREAGPELVGSIGRKTAVANNDQIISGIESGVYRAMVAANANSNSGSNQTIRIINEIDGDVVGEKVIKYHNGKVMQTGASPLLV